VENPICVLFVEGEAQESSRKFQRGTDSSEKAWSYLGGQERSAKPERYRKRGGGREKKGVRSKKKMVVAGKGADCSRPRCRDFLGRLKCHTKEVGKEKYTRGEFEQASRKTRLGHSRGAGRRKNSKEKSAAKRKGHFRRKRERGRRRH